MAVNVRAFGRSVIAVLAALGAGAVAAQSRLPGPGECPQPRFTGKAPEPYFGRKNPLQATADELGPARHVYEGKVGRSNCAICHGIKGDGRGPIATLYDPPPRNFACAQTVNGIPDGQLFWIIKYGSPGTGMPPNPELDERQVWQLVLYLRQLAK